MRKNLVIAAVAVLYLLFVAGCGEAVNLEKESGTEEAPTKLQMFLGQKGKLIIKDFYELGEVAGRRGSKIKLEAVVLYEPGLESESIKGLKIEITSGGEYQRSDTSFLDLDEVESLSEAIRYMLDLGTKWKDTAREYTEVIFSTKGDFEMGFAQVGTRQIPVASIGRVGEVLCPFRKFEDLTSMKDIVDEGLKVLREK